MRCKQVQTELSNRLSQKDFLIPDKLREHLDTCPECTAYLRELALLQNVLSEPVLSVIPGELDDISFENIIASEKRGPVRAPARSRGWRLGWILAPLTLVAAIVGVIEYSRYNPQPATAYISAGEALYTEQDIIGEIASNDTLPNQVISSLAANDNYLEYAADEIIDQAEVDELLESMTADELQALYKKIDELKG